jgi:hypothetical protein
VLRDEHGVATPRGLFPVVRRGCGREPPSDQLLGVGEHALEPALLEIGPIFRVEVKSSAEAGSPESREEIVE